MRKIYLVIAWLLWTPVISNATVRYVDNTASGANNGSSWTDAYKYLSSALAVANAAATSDTLYIAQGTYYPTGLQTGTNRDSTFLITRGGIKIYGGYPTGGGTRNIAANPTMLSGNINAANNNADNSYHVMVIAGIAATADSVVVDGITVTAGYANGSGSFTYGTTVINKNAGAGVNVASNNGNTKMAFRNATFSGNTASERGGGMYNLSSSPTIVNSTFSNNFASSYGYGGGICNSNSSPALKNCMFSKNTASSAGGGMSNFVNSSPSLTNCTFSENTGGTDGGGMENNNGSSPTLTDCTFSGNITGYYGGGMTNFGSSSPILTGCTFSGNKSDDNAGGMYNYSSSPTLTNCTFSGNTASTYCGGMDNYASSPTLTNCIFSGNTAGTSSGGMDNYSSSPTLKNCTFSGNTAGTYGGGMSNYASSPTLTNCTFSGNTGTLHGGGMHNENNSSPIISNCAFSGNAAGFNGGGMYNLSNCSPTLINCTFAGNRANAGGGAINNYDGTANPTITNTIIYGNTSGILNFGGTPVITYSLVQGIAAGPGNINGSTNPLFINPQPASAAPTTAGNYLLQASSPAVNAGNNDSVGYTPLIDLAGNPRIMGCTVDMGAYEYQTANSGTVFRTVYVDSANGSDAYSGGTWATAFKTLSYALNKAQLCNLTDSILVAKGTYYPTGTQTGANRDATFLIKRGGIKIYGGYPTGGGARNIAANPTILSGDINTAGNNTDNSFHVMVIAGLAATADSVVVDGISVTAGNANGSSIVTYGTTVVNQNTGAGIHAASNSGNTKITFRNCILSGNIAADQGGAMYNSFSAPTMANCTFSGNAAYYGAAMINSSSSSTLKNCIFSGNAANVGGAIYTYGSAPAITNCTFSGNTASGSLSGAMFNNLSSPTISNTIIFGNSSGISNVNSTPVITYSLVQGYNYSSNMANVHNLPDTTDPLFVSAQPASVAPTTAGDYRILPCSPAMNVGNNSAVPAGITTDLDGNPRIFGATVDMGAYEIQTNIVIVNPVIYVDSAAGNDTNTGTSWGAAFKTLSYALKVANTACFANLDSILIAQGTYYPTGIQTGTNRDSTFLILRGGLKIYGGYPTGGGTRNIAANPTILSGDINTANNNSDNSYHVIVIAGLAATADSVVVDGITVTAGNANGSGNFTYGAIVIDQSGGAGMHVTSNNGNTRMAFRNCTISDNTAYLGSGAMYISGSAPTVANCTFSGNTAYAGGAMHNASSPSTIMNCTFSGNTGYDGGAMYNSYSPVTLTNCTFSGNAAVSGNGGGIYNNYANPAIYNTIIFGNSSGIYNNGSTPVISYSLVQGTTTSTGNNINGNTDPMFVNPQPVSAAPTTAGDYRLQPCSQVINKGNNSAIPNGVTIDLDGNARRYNNGTVDMGAYEYQGIAAATTVAIYVDSANGNDANNGATWSTAFKTLSYALKAAQLCDFTDSILVTKGTYYPTGTQTGTKRDSTFLISRGGLKIYGGYPTGGGVRNIVTNPTIISGDINAAGNNADNSFHVMVIAGLAAEADSVVVDGITVTAGNANGSFYSIYGTTFITQNRGAGMDIASNNSNTRMAFRNCSFSGNTAWDYGGAMYSTGSAPGITNCTFSGNSVANHGGAMYNTGSAPTLINCTFSGNTAGNGGAMYNTSSALTMTSCTFSGNNAGSGGGMSNYTTNATIANTIIYGNSSGIYNYNSTPVISYSLVQGINTGMGNINGNTDPLFVNPQPASAAPATTGDYRLLPCSPAINAGRNDSIPVGITMDIAGNARIQLGTVDIGAYEATDNSADTSASLAGATIATTKTQSGTQFYAQDCSSLIATLTSINPAPASGSITAKVYVDATALTYNSQRYVRRHYDITPANTTVANTGTATITLYFTQADFDDYNTNRGTLPALPANPTDAAAGNFRVTQQHGSSSTGAPGSFTGWDGVGPANVLIAPTLAWNAVRSRWETTFPVTGFSGFFASTNTTTPLPLTLIAFTGKLLNNMVLLNWQTANEQNTHHFEVEKSTDGNRFTAFSSVNAMGSGGNKYYSIDRQPQTGDNFYRLKMVDKDGVFTHSQIVKVRMADAANAITMSVYPNPANQELFVNCTGSDEAATIGIYSIDGRLLQSKAIIRAGLYSFDIAALAEGTYVLIYQTSSTKLTRHFSKVSP
ncbi:right-handed parallel beta-helix repeat-containing protein [Taibaiella chishuiensis]|uniref:Putative secreted protein (Por secretion system target) n=1 Tax=Taibaiella chishuiensis TaxID=1434707 RepID=A0A2P8D2Z1_9BACT|nr:right-handed parallel beta-helix repeat-containing protein [Taibaiella chishuiensis]PSK91592.1 putative secreted protein (Por secretion system target) [Taibaiella chishuiensis]